MGQCCGFVKNDNGISIHHAQFSREIDEHLDKLEKERIDAQETSSQIGNNNINGSHLVNQIFHDGKDIGNHQSNLSNEIQKQRSAEAMYFKKETGYEDYEVKVVEPSPVRDSGSRLSSFIGDKSMQLSQNTKELAGTRSQEKLPSFIGFKRDESLIQNGKVVSAIGVEEIHLEPALNNSIILNSSNNNLLEKKESNSNTKEEEQRMAYYYQEQIAVNAAIQQQQYNSSLSDSKDPKKQLNLEINNSAQPNTSPSPSPQASPTSAQSSSPVPSPTKQQVKDQFIAGGGKKSILTNTLTKKDDPNSGSKPIISSEDHQEKQVKKVRLVTTVDKRLDTDSGQESGDHTPTKPKGVLKKYDPNAQSSDSDSPRNKPKKKVKFKESTFKKQSKKKKMQ